MAFSSSRNENALKGTLLANNDNNRSLVCDDELAGEPDEPPEQKTKLHRTLSQNGGFKKHTVNKIAKGESLLTLSILSDSDSAAATTDAPNSKRGFSTTSAISTGSIPSVAELTSDGGFTSPSRTNSPSPPLPKAIGFQLPRPVVPKQSLVAIKGDDLNEAKKAELQKADRDAVVEALGRKRCISFACAGGANKPKDEAKPKDTPKETEIVAPAPVRKCLLKFACDQKPEKPKYSKLQSPPPPQSRLTNGRTRANVVEGRRDSNATIVNNDSVQSKMSATPQSTKTFHNHRFHEFAGSASVEPESWMETPKRSHALMKADCLLEKERSIQKLSREVDDEVALEEELEDDDEEDDDIEVSDGGYEEDDEEEDDDYEAWTDSDENEDKDEEEDEEDGYDRDDEDDDDEDVDEVDGLFVQNPFTTSEVENRPLSTRTSSESSLASNLANKSGPKIPHPSARAMTPELPDSTDFVPGTFDEDKALEDAYKSCMEQRKLAKKVLTPQDIDPSFPTSEPEDYDDEEDEEAGSGKGGCEMWMKKSNGRNGRLRTPNRSRKNSTSESAQNSPRRVHSPAPSARRKTTGGRALSPAPISRRSSHVSAIEQASPRDVTIQNRIKFDFCPTRRPPIPHTKSLPRPGFHAGFRKRSSQAVTGGGSPVKQGKIPIPRRGAADIVKGLERKRRLRKEKNYTQKCKKEWKAEAGEGVEKMRELGLLNKERNAGVQEAPGAKWVLSI